MGLTDGLGLAWHAEGSMRAAIRPALLAFAVATLAACNEHPLVAVEHEVIVTSWDAPALPSAREVDVLFVIDDSGSMGEIQARLASSVAGFVDALEDAEANYRIAITTTDNGNYACRGPEHQPVGGNFVFSSCRSRLGDFVSGEGVDASGACESVCPAQWSEIVSKPTTIRGDPTPRSRPWIEKVAGESNLPDGLDVVTALECLLPQGTGGCEFESPLESMYLSLRRANHNGEDELGFIRDSAILAIVFVTDETDCSSHTDGEAIFWPEDLGGTRVFWSLPDQQTSPTSAVCWNAGVRCTPDDAMLYESCTPQNWDAAGHPLPDDRAEEAALRPVSRYVDLVNAIEENKQALDPSQEVVVAAIAGVPRGYPDVPLTYAKGGAEHDPESFQAQFGIAPGCASGGVRAVPPVRLAAFADAFVVEDAMLFSICEPSHAAAFEAIANAVSDQIRPACLRMCVADTDPDASGVQPDCRLTQTYRDEANELVEMTIAECDPGAVLPEGQPLCWAPMTDQAGLTSTTSDDMHEACIEQGWNVEARIVRQEGLARPDGEQIAYTCELSTNKELDCPGLPT
jgi:hypothetical protein